MPNASGIKHRNSPKPPNKEKKPLLSSPVSNPNPSPNLDLMPSVDSALNGSQFLSREEVLRRRSQRAKKLARVYQRHYWKLMEEIRVKHRDYYWEFGKSPLEEEHEEKSEEGERKRCGGPGCKSKAMALTRFCHQHILYDREQTLYKGCVFATKSSQPCGKPVLRSTVPSLCPNHFQRNQRQISQALKKAGLNSSSKPPPKFHVLISESVKQIQARRRQMLTTTTTADKPTDSSLRTMDPKETGIIGKKPPPVEKRRTILRGRLQDSVWSMMSWNPDKLQLPPAMTKVRLSDGVGPYKKKLNSFSGFTKM